ncbi:MAG: hypothetical protein WC564_04260 [Patescibacteria group bacterium]|jgi:hypothetical protein
MVIKIAPKTASILFWMVGATIILLSFFVIIVSKKITLINQALASEFSQNNYYHHLVVRNNLVDCGCEDIPLDQEDLVVEAQVIATFVSGLDLGVRNLDLAGEYSQFYVDAGGKYQGDINGHIRIKGRLLGMTCAYANSVFGECVPEIEASVIEVLK